jgi:hypothetical protein
MRQDSGQFPAERKLVTALLQCSVLRHSGLPDKTRPPRKGQSVARSTKIETEQQAVPPGGKQVTGRSSSGERRVQRTINFDRETLERARAAAMYLATHEPEAEVRSLADIVNPAVLARVTELERRFNDGHPFQPVGRLPRGRRRSTISVRGEAGADAVTLRAPAGPENTE